MCCASFGSNGNLRGCRRDPAGLGLDDRLLPRWRWTELPAHGEWMLTETDRRILAPLIGGPQTLTQEGVRVLQDLTLRGYVRLSLARCGPLAVVTGEFLAELTEAGLIVMSMQC